MRILFTLLAGMMLASAQTDTFELITPRSSVLRIDSDSPGFVAGPVIKRTAGTNDVIVTISYSGDGTNALASNISTVRIPGARSLVRDILRTTTNIVGGDSFTATLSAGSLYLIGQDIELSFSVNPTNAIEVVPANTAPSLTFTNSPTSGDAALALTLTSGFSDAEGNDVVNTVSYHLLSGGAEIATWPGDMNTVNFPASVTITNAGSFSLYAKASYFDPDLVAMTLYSATNAITVSDPTITPSIDAPAADSTHTVGDSVTFTGSATLGSSTITQIAFYENDVEITGSPDSSDPYSLTWTPATTGTRTLKIVVTRDAGGTAETEINVTVVPVANQPPTATLQITPTSETSLINYTEGSVSVPLLASASDLDGTVANVKFYRGVTLLATDSSAPYTYTDTASLTPGAYSYSAVAEDDDTDTTTSNTVNATIVAATPYALNFGGTFNTTVSTSINLNPTEDNGPADSWLWEKVSGPGNLTFGSATALSTTVSSDASGDHVIRITATKGGTGYIRTATLSVDAAGVSNSIPAPLLVFDSDGDGWETVSVDVYLESYTWQAGYGWFMRVYNLYHDNQLDVRFNGGSWKDITPSSVRILENNLNGHHGDWLGHFPIKRLIIPLNSGELTTGWNTIQYRFRSFANGDKHTNIQPLGMRILEQSPTDQSDAYLLDSGDFSLVDYSSLSSPGNAANGASLWSNRSILTSSPSNASPKGTSCADCHFSGYELMNHELASIVGRSRFHGLTEAQGQDIAAHIYALTPTYEPANLRPWTSFFQPGPTVAADALAEWVAGETTTTSLSGIRIPDYFDTAQEFITAVYGSPISTNNLHWNSAAAVDLSIKTKRYFPHLDLNQGWLPVTHPIEAKGLSWWNGLNFKTHVETTLPGYYSGGGSHSSSRVRWEELIAFRTQMRDNYFASHGASGAHGLQIYNNQRIGAMRSIDLRLKHGLDATDLYAQSWMNTRTGPQASVWFDSAPLQSKVGAGASGVPIGDHTNIGVSFHNLLWYDDQFIMNPFPQSEIRYIDRNPTYIQGTASMLNQAIKDSGPGIDNNSTLFPLLGLYYVEFIRMNQRSNNPEDAYGGPYLFQIFPAPMLNNTWWYTNGANKAQRREILEVVLQNAMDRIEAISDATWQSTSYIASKTTGSSRNAANYGQYIDIFHWTLDTMKNSSEWGFNKSTSVAYNRIYDWVNDIWPSNNWSSFTP